MRPSTMMTTPLASLSQRPCFSRSFCLLSVYTATPQPVRHRTRKRDCRTPNSRSRPRLPGFSDRSPMLGQAESTRDFFPRCAAVTGSAFPRSFCEKSTEDLSHSSALALRAMCMLGVVLANPFHTLKLLTAFAASVFVYRHQSSPAETTRSR
jgi:hypothetical protein